MKTIHLYGDLSKTISKRKLRLDVVSPSEAIRALVVSYPHADTALREGSFLLIRRTFDTASGRIALDDMSKVLADETSQISLEEMDLALGKADLHIIPVVGGAGGRGIGKVLLGVAMVAGAFALAPVTGGASVAAGGAAMKATAFSLLGMNITFGTIATMGAMIALQGVSAILAKPPKAAKPEDKNESFLFGGPVNVSSQGNPVPIVYGGPIRTGSVIISSRISTESTGGRIDTNGFTGVKGAVFSGAFETPQQN